MLYLGSHGQRAQERAREKSVLEQVGLRISFTSRGRGRVGYNFERLPDCATTKLLSPRAPRTTSDATHWLHIVGRRKKEMRSEEVQVTPFSKGVFFVSLSRLLYIQLSHPFWVLVRSRASFRYFPAKTTSKSRSRTPTRSLGSRIPI